MAAPAPPLLQAQMANFQAMGFAMQADLAPLATQAQLAAAIAPLATQAQVNALAAQGNALAAQVNALAAQGNALAAQIAALPTLAQIQALLAPHNAPAIAAAAAATVQAIVSARVRNAHDRSGEPYGMVPLADGTPPPNWPIGFERDALINGGIAVVDSLLADYGLANGPPIPVVERRNTLARYIGTTLM